MRRIHKYLLNIADRQVLEVGGAPIIRHVGMQGGDYAYLWIEVDLDEPECNLVIHVEGTGHEIRGKNYVGTVKDGSMVWHVYEGDA